MSKPKRESRRKPIAPKELVLEHFRGHMDRALNREPDLGAALVCTALVETALITLLSSFLVECETSKGLFDERGGVLGDLGKCRMMAYSLGLISKPMLQNLELIGDIRNRFAHSREFITFSDPDISKWCSGLTLPPYPQLSDPSVMEEFETRHQDPQERFKVICIHLWATFVSRSTIIKRIDKLPDDYIS